MKNRKRRSFLQLMATLLSLCLLMPVMAQRALAAEPETQSEPECYLHGDVNGDGKVNVRDAVYVLYYSLQQGDGPRSPSQNCDFNGDGSVTAADAIYVLYNTLGGSFAQSHALNGTVHKYFAPLWTWKDDGTVQVELKCACGDTKTLDAAVEVTKEQLPTCVSAGVKECTATAAWDGETYKDTKTVTAPALGHTMEGTLGCETGRTCAACGYEELPLGHNWVEDPEHSTPATCQAEGVQAYKCTREGCKETKTVTLEGKAAHAYVWNRTETDGCKRREVYRCGGCGAEQSGEPFFRHTYDAVLTKDATCTDAGVKTFTCSACGDTYTESVPKNDAHVWISGETENGITTYACKLCGAVKTAICEEGNTASVSQDALKKADEVQLSDVKVTMDDTAKDSLGDSEKVTISIDTSKASSLPLTAEQKAQIGTNPVYDFTLTSDDTAVSEFGGGYVTISLPYNLQPGDDVDCIDVWFIEDSGKVTCVKGTYSNGYVTFRTDHFSYYTVTRLTPAQRCEAYGHAIVKSELAPTCTRDGYHTEVCQRCGDTLVDEKLDKTGHSYVENRTEPTCEKSGSFSKKCSACGETVSGELPALGHNWVVDEKQSEAATCEHPGKIVSTCIHDGCGLTRTEELPQLQHDFGDSIEAKPDCTNQGSTERVCVNCGYKEILDTQSPTGHDFRKEDAVWAWNDDLSGATVTLVCANDPSHTKALEAVVTSKTEAASCSAAGKVTYTAAASYNTVTYTSEKTKTLDLVPHQPEEQWQSNAAQHYHLCRQCQERVNAADHIWGEQTVIQAATCSADGKAEQACSVCGYTREIVLNATGEHSFVNGVCKDCGFVENACTHIRTTATLLDLSAYGVCDGASVVKESCDCGQHSELYIDRLTCDFSLSSREMVFSDGRTAEVSVYTCAKCGLVMESYNYWKLDEAACTSSMAYVTRLLMAGKEIAAGESVDPGMEVRHCANIPEASVDLAQYGLCGGTVVKVHCHCGEVSSAYIADEACRWKWDQAQSSDAVQVFTCGVCGAVKKVAYSHAPGEETCTQVETAETILEQNGKEVYRFTSRTTYIQHTYEIVKTELDGKTCEDGVYVKHVCKVCGKVYEGYYKFHVMTEFTDTPLDGFCADSAIQATCACGQNKEFYLTYPEDAHCRWQYIEDNIESCRVCGLTCTRTETVGPKDVNNFCLCQITVDYTYTDAEGKLLASGVERFIGANHNDITEYTLLGKTCEDGVMVKAVCQDCGDTRTRVVNFHESEHTEYDLSEYGLCGGKLVAFSCPCGEEAGIYEESSPCMWMGIPSDVEDGYSEICETCGVVRTIAFTEHEPIDSCTDNATITFTYTKDGEELLKVSGKTRTTHHRSVFSFTLDGESCEDGYTVHETCLECGETSDWHDSSDRHGLWPTQREMLSTGTLCGDMELVTRSCACGEETDSWIDWTNGSCRFEDWTNIGENTYQETCAVCGAVSTTYEESFPEEGTCRVKYIDKVTITKDGEAVCSYERTSSHWEHNFVYTFQLDGETCQDGYRAIGTCVRCGEETVQRIPGVDCDKRNWKTGYEELVGGDACCGSVTKETYGCACGRYHQVAIRDYECDWEYAFWDGQSDHFVCNACGLEKAWKSSEAGNPDSCERAVDVTVIYSKDGVELANETFRNIEPSHEYLATYELLGSTCGDGYRVTLTCARCGETAQQGHDVQYDHADYCTAAYDLSAYGMCGGNIRCFSCACGEEAWWSYDWGDCLWEPTGKTDSETGLEIEYCAKCDTYRCCGDRSETLPGSCLQKGTFHAVFTRNGETLLALHQPTSWWDHKMVVTDVHLNDPEQGCEGGYTVTLSCLYCDENDRSSGSDHDTYNSEYVELQTLYPDACGGYLVLRSCPCGERSDWETTYDCDSLLYDYSQTTDADGHLHEIETRTCETCGLSFVWDTYSVQLPNSCEGTHYITQTVSAKGQDLKTVSYTNTFYSHTYETTYELLPGHTTCEDGLQVVRTCKLCGETIRYRQDSGEHCYNLDADGSIDLAPYGSVCGGKLAHYVCPCGAREKYDLDPELLCDLDRVRVDNWIPGTIDDYQYTSEGYVDTRSHSYRMKCAVTDPQCGLTLRMSEYWLEENCLATEYQTWQLGYDEAAGTCMKEITVPTGESHAYHPYTHTTVVDILEDGTEVSGYQDLCPQCGSSYTYHLYSRNHTTVKQTKHADNTLDNGENKSYDYVREYGVENAGYRYLTLEREEFVHGDGSAKWWQFAYTYDFSQGCVRVCRYTNSDGNEWVRQEDAHEVAGSWETVKDATCTQFGQRRYRETCKVCQQVVYENFYDVTPTAHFWNWDSAQGIYRCSVCGLENVNGASGSIVIEDMTDYENGTEYMVGYWNRGNVEAKRYVSVVLKDAAEGTDDELVLTDIPFTELTREKDGVTAVTFSRDAVRQAAAKAVSDAGYTGAYAIRFTFVPINEADTLDYAITFDTLSE